MHLVTPDGGSATHARARVYTSMDMRTRVCMVYMRVCMVYMRVCMVYMRACTCLRVRARSLVYGRDALIVQP